MLHAPSSLLKGEALTMPSSTAAMIACEQCRRAAGSGDTRLQLFRTTTRGRDRVPAMPPMGSKSTILQHNIWMAALMLQNLHINSFHGGLGKHRPQGRWEGYVAILRAVLTEKSPHESSFWMVV
jgi:hypothetical protein